MQFLFQDDHNLNSLDITGIYIVPHLEDVVWNHLDAVHFLKTQDGLTPGALAKCAYLQSCPHSSLTHACTKHKEF